MRGRITKRGDSWRIVVDAGTDPATGKRHQHSETHRTKREAERRLAEIVQQANQGLYVKPSRLTVSLFLRQWLSDYAKVNTRPRTFENYRSKIERHVIPAIGQHPLMGLRPEHVAALYHSMLDEGASPRSVLHVHRIISNALGQAVRWQMVPRNVAQVVTPPRPRKAETHALAPANLRRVLEAFQSSPYYGLLYLAAFSGARRSEILGLRWQDVDFDRGTIRIVQTLHQLIDGTLVFEEPKTQSGRRTIPLSTSAVLALRAHRERSEAEQALGHRNLDSDALVFIMPDGRPIKPYTISQAFRRVVRRLGLNVRLHDLRHTHASVLLLAGVHPKAVQERLGHANISITLDTYTHLLPGIAEATADQFEDAMRDQRDTVEVVS